MSVDRISRINQLLKQEIAQSLFKILHEPDIDLSAITVTRVLTSRDLHQARVYVSITGSDEQQQALMNRIRDHRTEIQGIINRNITMRYTPRLNFILDDSIKQGDHVLHILADLEAEADGPGGDTMEEGDERS